MWYITKYLSRRVTSLLFSSSLSKPSLARAWRRARLKQNKIIKSFPLKCIIFFSSQFWCFNKVICVLISELYTLAWLMLWYDMIMPIFCFWFWWWNKNKWHLYGILLFRASLTFANQMIYYLISLFCAYSKIQSRKYRCLFHIPFFICNND